MRLIMPIIDINDPEISKLLPEQKKILAEKRVLKNTIQQDQALITDRWANAIIHAGPEGEEHAQAINAMLLSFATIFHGQFEISTHGKSGACSDWERPNHVLSIVDYFSHGSRVMIDLNAVSEENRNYFLTHFPKGIGDINGRASTHRSERVNGELVEIKSKRHGVGEEAKSFVHVLGHYTNLNYNQILNGNKLTDYGINLTMGGLDQLNFIGGISKPGAGDGHLLYHLGEANSVMLGLEQTEPGFSVKNKVNHIDTFVSNTNIFFKSFIPHNDNSSGTSLGSTTTSETSSETDAKIDYNEELNTGLTCQHSILGYSDSSTAPGSLYFSNLIYKLKLFFETKTLTPSKYNGMRVKIVNDRKFTEIIECYQHLLELKQEKKIDEIKSFLKQLPKNYKLYNDDGAITVKKLIFQIENLNEFFNQLTRVYKLDFTPYKNGLESKLEELKIWILWLRSTANPNPIQPLIPMDITADEDNPHILHLFKFFNLVIHKINQEISFKIDKFFTYNRPQEFFQLTHLIKTYERNPKITTPTGTYKELLDIESKIKEMEKKFNSREPLENYDWVQITQTHLRLITIFNTPDCQTLLMVMEECIHLKNQKSDLHSEIKESNDYRSSSSCRP